MATEDKPGKNIHKPALRVRQSSLRMVTPGSLFKRYCPECGEGILPCRRAESTFRLQRYDRCTFCGQQFVYIDKKIGEEELEDLPN